MDAPDRETRCLDRLPFWNLICHLELGHLSQHYGDDDAERAGYWGRGVVHVERVRVMEFAP